MRTTSMLLLAAVLSGGCSRDGLWDRIFGRDQDTGDPPDPDQDTADSAPPDDSGAPCDEPDADGDGHDRTACGGDDCDDADASVHPGAAEVCDGLDTDCDGVLAEDESDADGDGWPLCAGDCDDGRADLNPSDADGDGLDSCSGDCSDANAALLPWSLANPMVFVWAAAAPDGADGSLAHPWPTLQQGIDAALHGNAVVCVGPGTYTSAAFGTRAGLELLGPGDGSAVVDGTLTLGAVTDSRVAGLTLDSLKTTNSASQATLRLVVEHNFFDCDDEDNAIFFGLGDHYNVVRDNEIRGCDYGLYMNGNHMFEEHLVHGNHFAEQTWNAVHFNWNLRSLVMNNRVDGVGRSGDGDGGVGVDAYAYHDLWLGNTIVGSYGYGMALEGYESSYQWVFGNLLVDNAEAGIVSGGNNYVGYNNLIGNGSASALLASAEFLLEGNYDDHLPVPPDGWVAARARTSPVPADWTREIDVDLDGDDDRGDTLCAVGAWGDGNPLFGAGSVTVTGSGCTAVVSWTPCEGDADEHHAQASYQVQLATTPWVHQPAAAWDSGEVAGAASAQSLPAMGAAAWVRVRIKDARGTWSAWSDGFDEVAP